jgi:hypothetical protein
MLNIHLQYTEGEAGSSGEACYLYLAGTWFESPTFSAVVWYVNGLFVKITMA